MSYPDFPRSYHVLYWCTQVCNIGAGLGFGLAALFGWEHSAWWCLTVPPGWLFFAAWRLVGRAYFRQRERELEELWGKAYAERDMLLALQARAEGREQ